MSDRKASTLTEIELQRVQSLFNTSNSKDFEAIHLTRIADVYDLETIYQSLNKDNLSNEGMDSKQDHFITFLIQDDIFDKDKIEWFTKKALLKVADFVTLGLFKEAHDIMYDLDFYFPNLEVSNITENFKKDIIDSSQKVNPQMRTGYLENFHKSQQYLKALENHFGEKNDPDMTAIFSKAHAFAEMKSNDYVEGKGQNPIPIPQPE